MRSDSVGRFGLMSYFPHVNFSIMEIGAGGYLEEEVGLFNLTTEEARALGLKLLEVADAGGLSDEQANRIP